MRFSICNETFQDWSLEATMSFCAKSGYDAIEIAPFTLASRVTDLTPNQRQEIAVLAKKNHLSISAIHWVLAKTEGFYLTSPDPEVRSRTAAYLTALVDFCADVGAGFIVLGSPKQRNLLPGVSVSQATDFALNVLRPAVQRAEDRGVVICLEPLAPSETDFITTASQARNLVDTAASRALRIILDVKAMSSESLPIPEIIEQSRQHVAYFHANDRNLKGPGFGDVDFVPIARALRSIHYNGFVSVEVFDYSDGPETIATRSLSYLKEAFSSEGYPAKNESAA